ncbi:MAG: hypothetical protein WCK55_13885 [Verrucomicrobiota bacterium]
MASIIHPASVDLRTIATAVKGWLDRKKFETKAFEAAGSYILKARKGGKLRAVLSIDRALEILVTHSDGKTVVDIRQGSWKTNAVSNVAWLAVTGGTNLLLSGWSVVIQKELESYIRSILAEYGAREVDLTSNPAVAPVAVTSQISGIPTATPVQRVPFVVSKEAAAAVAPAATTQSFQNWYRTKFPNKPRGIQAFVCIFGGYLWWVVSTQIPKKVTLAAGVVLVVILVLRATNEHPPRGPYGDATQAEANAFLGLTQKALIQRLGQPISVEVSNSPDGPFKMIKFDRTAGKETFFTIFVSDGRVSSGYYRGTPISTSAH